MPVRPLTRLLALAACGIVSTAGIAEAQLPRSIGRTIRNAAESEVRREIDRLVRTGVRCVFDDFECINRAKQEGKTPVMTDDQGNLLTDKEGRPLTDPAQAASQMEEKPGTGAWANYDFVPGERVLFAEDFSADTVGDFPRRLTLVKGNWEIVEWQGRRLLRNTGPRGAAVRIQLPEDLPERFTIELDVHFPHVNQMLALATYEPERPLVGTKPIDGNHFRIGRNGTGVAAGKKAAVEALTVTKSTIESGMTPIRIMADGQHVKVFVNERRVANVPNAQFSRGRVIHLENTYFANEKDPMYIASVRIAAGGRDLYDVLETDGRVATQGIYFATNSDRIRPESTPTLKEIGEMLQQHPSLRLSIEGHTDGDGEEAYNQQLSERRAASVKRYLVDTYRIDAARLETAGHGESKPVADNSTPEGKQQNRRVELVKLGG